MKKIFFIFGVALYYPNLKGMGAEIWQEEPIEQSSYNGQEGFDNRNGYYSGVPCAQEFFLPGNYPAHLLPQFCPILWAYIPPENPVQPTIVSPPFALETFQTPNIAPEQHLSTCYQKSLKENLSLGILPQNRKKPIEFVQWSEQKYKELVEKSCEKTEQKHKSTAIRLQKVAHSLQKTSTPRSKLKKRTSKK